MFTAVCIPIPVLLFIEGIAFVMYYYYPAVDVGFSILKYLKYKNFALRDRDEILGIFGADSSTK